MMKKILCLLMCLVFALSCAACAASEGDLTTGTESDSFDGLFTDGFEDTASISDLPVTDSAPALSTETVTDSATGSSTAPATNSATDSASSSATVSESVTDTTTAERITATVTQDPYYSDPTTTVEEVLSASSHLVGLCDQLNKRLIVRDMSQETWTKSNVVWEYTGYSAAGIKFRDCPYWGGEVVIACGEASAIIVDYKTKKQLLKTKDVAHNPHSVEILPNGVFAVASSTGGEVRIFGAGKTTHSASINLPYAHGVLWDPANECLWVAGDNVLAAYRVTGSAVNPKVEAIEGKKYYPSQSLHDLSPVYGNPDCLLLTGSKGVVMFNKKTGKTSYDYEGGAYAKTQSYVPGVGNFLQDDVLVFTTIRSDTLTFEEWGTDQVGMYVPLGGNRGRVIYRQCKSDAYYKVRVWSTSYQ